jgi:hypothetical protein
VHLSLQLPRRSQAAATANVNPGVAAGAANTLLLPPRAGVFSLLAATEITDGVFYPVGGFSKVRHSRLPQHSTAQHTCAGLTQSGLCNAWTCVGGTLADGEV